MAKSSAATASGEISATNNLNKKAHLPLGALQTVDKAPSQEGAFLVS